MPFFTSKSVRPTVAANSLAATNFAARTGVLGAPYDAAYTALLNGLTTDGLFNSDGTSNYFDFLKVYASATSTAALLNLVGNIYNSTNASGLTFTAGRGFTGDGVGGHSIDSNFNPSTASSPKYVRDSAHLSGWSLTSGAAGAQLAACGSTNGVNIICREPGDTTYIRINDQSASAGFAGTTDGSGQFLGNRDGGSSRQGYHNATSVGTYGSVTSDAIATCADTDILFINGMSYQLAASSAGASLNSTLVTAFYNRLRTYMTAIGVP